MKNLLQLLNLTGIIPSPITVYLMLGIAAGSAFGGGWVVYKFWQASEVTAVNLARAKERDAVMLGNEHEKGVLERARIRKEQTDALIEDLRLRLANGTYCNTPIPPAWVRQHDQLPRTPPDTRRPRPADPPVAAAPRSAPDPGPQADSRDVVLTCERNRIEVYQPEADERASLRAWYNDLRKRYNRR